MSNFWKDAGDLLGTLGGAAVGAAYGVLEGTIEAIDNGSIEEGVKTFGKSVENGAGRGSELGQEYGPSVGKAVEFVAVAAASAVIAEEAKNKWNQQKTQKQIGTKKFMDDSINNPTTNSGNKR